MTDADLKTALIGHAGVALPDGADGVLAAAEAVDVWSAALILGTAMLGIRHVDEIARKRPAEARSRNRVEG